MNEYRISKYDLTYRKNGVYIKEDWTSISDIGKVYDGNLFTLEDYLIVEDSYLRFIHILCTELDVHDIKINGLEDYKNKCKYVQASTLSINDVLQISRGCLREEYWCRLESDQIFFHFGYDYYMYIVCSLSY